MKKNIGIAVVLGIFILSVFLTDIVPTSESIAKDLKINERLNNHPEISRMSGKENGIVLSDLPQVVKSAVISKYIAYSMETISREQESVFRIVLKNESSRLVVYYTEEGDYLRQEAVKPVQMVALY